MVYALTNWTVLFKVLKIWIKCRWNKKAVNKRTRFSIGAQMLTHTRTQWTSSCVTIYLLYYWMLLQILFCIIPLSGKQYRDKTPPKCEIQASKRLFRLEDASSYKYFMIVHLSYAICIILGVYTSLLTKVSAYSNIIEFPAKQCRDTEVNSTKQPADRQENCPVWVLQDKRRCWQRWNWSLCWNKSPYTWSTLLIISMAELVWQSVVDHMAPRLTLMSAQASPCWAKAGHGLVGLLSKDFERGHHHEGSVVCAPSLTLAGVSGHKWLQVSSVSEQFKFTTEKTLLCSNQFIITDGVYSKITLS